MLPTSHPVHLLTPGVWFCPLLSSTFPNWPSCSSVAAVVTADSPPSSVSTQGSVTHPHPAASSSLLCMGRPSPKLPPLQRRLCVCACMRPVCTCSCVCALGSLRHFYTYLVLVYSHDSLISHPLALSHVLTWTPPPIFLPTFTCVLLPSLPLTSL